MPSLIDVILRRREAPSRRTRHVSAAPALLRRYWQGTAQPGVEIGEGAARQQRLAVGILSGSGDNGGNNPKLTFIG